MESINDIREKKLRQMMSTDYGTREVAVALLAYASYRTLKNVCESLGIEEECQKEKQRKK